LAQRKEQIGQSSRLSNCRQRDPRKSDILRAAKRARVDLAQTAPVLSAHKPAGRLLVAFMILVTAAVWLGGAGVQPFQSFWANMAFVLIALGLLRVLTCLVASQGSQHIEIRPQPEAAPVWTILIALYNEADSVPSLLEALSKLSWRKDRLDLIFACEHDDALTIATLVANQRAHNFRIVRVPSGGPRTKPHALQTALPFARGRYICVYDAEDRPHPEQVRAAFQAFLTGPSNLAVVQAPLVTWNHKESWIARQFALDYAIWFRVMLPAFARISGLIPLGGTSNHFRTDILRAVGGWDPYNVTEDADLGIRLARNGYIAELISPPTYEEAPPKIGAWIKQRGRWIQGHVQTFSLHLRTPLSLMQQIGWRGLFAFFIGLGIGPMSALLVLPLTLAISLSLVQEITFKVWLPLAFALAGHVIVAAVACGRDGRWSLMSCVITLPLYHCLQSVAACRAMWRVVFTPSFWDKTDHGCAARAPKDKGISAWMGQRH
jgi:glycosyltransferase XagB